MGRSLFGAFLHFTNAAKGERETEENGTRKCEKKQTAKQMNKQRKQNEEIIQAVNMKLR